jgi:putative phage-type endonuclease
MDDEDMVVVEARPSIETVKADLKDRKTFLGGSDAPIVLGLSHWKTRYELWQEKTGEKEPDDISEIERIRWGVILEDVVATEYTRRTGKKVRRVNQRQIDKYLPWMVAQIDRRIVGGGLLEIKTAGASMGGEWGPEGTAEIPPAYYCQVQHQMSVTGDPFAEVAVLIGGNSMRLYHVPRDEAFIIDMVQAESLFWDLVQARTPPDPISLDEAALRWSKAPSQAVIGSPIHGALAAQYLELADQISDLKVQQDTVRLTLEEAMRDIGDTLMVNGKAVASWKGQARDGLDAKALEEAHPEIAAQYRKTSEYRVFRALKAALDYKTSI